MDDFLRNIAYLGFKGMNLLTTAKMCMYCKSSNIVWPLPGAKPGGIFPAVAPTMPDADGLVDILYIKYSCVNPGLILAYWWPEWQAQL
ncbi:hypothetical protein [Hymenobacter sp. IS2118]|uniref:hypothetical protein n=1 Tax=Hymenobacter sp. IS2118 TaxID=1505605 RepID=UPI001377BF0F|nr:hypothetical protein [Hymenobacter sp. IS2118]